MSSHAADLARRLARNAEAVCRHYLSNGHREIATGWSAMPAPRGHRMLSGLSGYDTARRRTGR